MGHGASWSLGVGGSIDVWVNPSAGRDGTGMRSCPLETFFDRIHYFCSSALSARDEAQPDMTQEPASFDGTMATYLQA